MGQKNVKEYLSDLSHTLIINLKLFKSHNYTHIIKVGLVPSDLGSSLMVDWPTHPTCSPEETALGTGTDRSDIKPV